VRKDIAEPRCPTTVSMTSIYEKFLLRFVTGL
jgi:hypothetical protein